MRWKRAAVWTFVGLAVVLLALRIAAPRLVLRYVNGTLDGLEGYSGHVADIDLAIWRGAYQLRDVEIVKSTDKVPVPLFAAPRIDLSVQWKALLDGSIVAEIELHQPKINLVAEAPAPGESEEALETQETAPNWQDQVKALVPLRINHVAVHGGEAHFRNLHTEPKVDLFLRDIQGRLENLTNSEEFSQSMVARAHFTGIAMGSGRFKLDANVDPYSERPTFDLDAEIEGLKLANLNDFLRAYANLDAEAGTLSAYAEVKSEDGRFRGYVKPMVSGAKLLNWKKEEEGFFGKLWEAIAEGAKQLLESEATDRVATRIPLRGQMENPEADIWTTVVYVLRNAFVEALRTGIEGSVGAR